MKQTQNRKKKNPAVFLWALLPLVNAGLYYPLIFIDTRVWILIRPVFEVSVVSVLGIALFFFLTGLGGYRFARSGVSAPVSVLAGNAIPIICAATVFISLLASGEESGVAAVAGLVGNGFFVCFIGYFSNLTSYISVALQELICLVTVILTFIVGYAAGISKNSKVPRSKK